MEHLKLEGTSESTLEVTRDQEGKYWFEVDSPWSGDSETGFGRKEMVWLTKEQAAELRDFLIRMLG